MELLSSAGYVVSMVRLFLVLALVVTMSLKHFERAPTIIAASTDSLSEITLATGLSATVVRSKDCDDKYHIAGHPMQSQKSECKAVIGEVADSVAESFDEQLPVRDTSVFPAIRLVDLPPPRA